MQCPEADGLPIVAIDDDAGCIWQAPRRSHEAQADGSETFFIRKRIDAANVSRKPVGHVFSGDVRYDAREVLDRITAAFQVIRGIRALQEELVICPSHKAL